MESTSIRLNHFSSKRIISQFKQLNITSICTFIVLCVPEWLRSVLVGGERRRNRTGCACIAALFTVSYFRNVHKMRIYYRQKTTIRISHYCVLFWSFVCCDLRMCVCAHIRVSKVIQLRTQCKLRVHKSEMANWKWYESVFCYKKFEAHIIDYSAGRFCHSPYPLRLKVECNCQDNENGQFQSAPTLTVATIPGHKCKKNLTKYRKLKYEMPFLDGSMEQSIYSSMLVVANVYKSSLKHLEFAF